MDHVNFCNLYLNRKWRFEILLCFAFRRGKFPYFKTAPDGWKVSVNVVIESILRMTGAVPAKFEFKNIRSS